MDINNRNTLKVIRRVYNNSGSYLFASQVSDPSGVKYTFYNNVMTMKDNEIDVKFH
jgi:predicted phage gp36 major capsid-like protein